MGKQTGTIFAATVMGALTWLASCSQEPAAEATAAATAAPAVAATPAGNPGAGATTVKPAPRLPNGQVNLGLAPGERGFWGSSGSIYGRGRLSASTNLLVEEIPFQPWAKALYEFRQANNEKDDPHSRCLPGGPTREIETVNGFEILQMPDLNRVYFTFGGGEHSWRVVYTDSRPLPDVDNPDTIPVYMGYSSAHWEGDTLVVESTGFNEKMWFTQGGLPHTRYLHLTERFSRPDYDTLNYEITVDDPGAYTKPWNGAFSVKWNYTSWDGSDAGEIHEYYCQDNNRDVQHMIGN
jgi:hypothetical protein